MTAWGMYRLADMIGQFGVEKNVGGKWVRAVPLPYHANFFERLRPAFLVLTGRAYAIDWPEDGDLEKALRRGMPQ